MWILLLPPIALSLGVAYLLGAFDTGDTPSDEVERLTDGDDEFTGDGDRDEVYAGDGDDLLNGAGGDDVLRGEQGNDIVLGGGGNDQIGGQYDTVDSNGDKVLDDQGQAVRVGGEGVDLINGGTGDDRVFGGDGNDLILGKGAIDISARLMPDENITVENFANGFDELDDAPFTAEEVRAFLSDAQNSDAGNDLLRGGAGNDLIVDTSGSDTIYGDTGNDQIMSVDKELGQADRIYGGFGADSILADDGDVLTGGAGDDVFGVVVQSDQADPVSITDWAPGDRIEVDILNKENPSLNVTFDADSSAILVSESGQVLVRIEGMTSGQLASVQASVRLSDDDANANVGDLAPNEIEGDANDNQLTGTSSVDHIRGLAGNDIVLAGDGADKVGGREEVTDEDGSTTMAGGEGDDLINPGAGNDKVFAADGNDRIFGADYLTLVNRDLPEDERVDVATMTEADLNIGDDEPYTASQLLAFLKDGTNSDLGDDLLRGGAGDDMIADVRGANTLYGDTGKDELISIDMEQGQADSVFGGWGSDRLLVDDGDVVSGGEGQDRFDVMVRFENAEAVRITDWEQGEAIRLDMTSNDPLSFTFDEATSAVLVQQGDTTLVDVRATTALTAADVARVQAAVSVIS